MFIAFCSSQIFIFFSFLKLRVSYFWCYTFARSWTWLLCQVIFVLTAINRIGWTLPEKSAFFTSFNFLLLHIDMRRCFLNYIILLFSNFRVRAAFCLYLICPVLLLLENSESRLILFSKSLKLGFCFASFSI